jgi:hypothetical protein
MGMGMFNGMGGMGGFGYSPQMGSFQQQQQQQQQNAAASPGTNASGAGGTNTSGTNASLNGNTGMATGFQPGSGAGAPLPSPVVSNFGMAGGHYSPAAAAAGKFSSLPR